ncbi:MAG: amidohydrolase family protein [Sulfitobacter sp.]
MTIPSRILTNGKIWCGLNEGFAEAIAISDDKVLAVGSAADIGEMAGPETDVVDLEGRLATPGLNDAHLHLHMYGISKLNLDLREAAGMTTVQAILDLVAEAVSKAEPGTWITGRGYDHDKLAELRHPHRRELDAVAPNNPVMLTRA